MASFISFFLAVLLASGLLSSGAGHATTFIERPFAETVESAPIIVRGVVAGSYTDWSGPQGDQRIFTFYDLQVSEVFKGEVSGRTIVMREMGGEKDGIGMQVAGAARFERGDDVVVFLGVRNPDSTYPVRGMMMGRYDIAKDEDDREYLVGAGISGGGDHRHNHDAHPEHSPGDASPPRRWTLAQLRDLVREQQAREEKKPVIPSNNAAPTHGVASPESEKQAAPQLQFSDPESPPAFANSGENEGLPNWLAIALGGLGAFGALMFLFRRSR